MKLKRRILYFFGGLAYACTCALTPFAALADSSVPPENGAATAGSSAPPVIITEIQTRGASVAQEFIELYNTTDVPIDVSDWAIWYLPAVNGPDKLSAGNIMRLQAAGAVAGSPTVIAAHGYYVLSDGGDVATADQTYATSQGLLADSGGNVWLVSPGSVPCTFVPQDEVGWGGATQSAGSPARAPAAGQSIERFMTAAGNYVDSDNNSADFGVSTAANVPTPGAMNDLVASAPALSDATPTLPAPAVVDPTCTPPQTSTTATDSDAGSSGTSNPSTTADDGLTQASGDGPPATIVTTAATSATADATQTPATQQPSVPASDNGLAAPQLTELLPNPASPQTDAADEFIELYNPNAASFDLSGFELEAGSTTKHYAIFPAGTLLAAHSFTAFFSANMALDLSNSGGQVWLLDPLGNVIGQTAAYGTAKDGQAWALANGNWYWTTMPTPNAPNVITAPATKAASAASTASKKTSAAKTGAKSSAKTASSGKAKSSVSSTVDDAQLDAAIQPTPVHPYVLAVAALFALLYGAYEYRRDVANKFYEFRSYRSARRKNRASVKRWRGH